MKHPVLVTLTLLLAFGALAVASPGAAQAPADVLRIALGSDVTMNPFTQPQQLTTSYVMKAVFSTIWAVRPLI